MEIVDVLLDLLKVTVLYVPFVWLIEQMDTYMQKARPKVVDDDADTKWHKYEGLTKAYIFLIAMLLANVDIAIFLRGILIIIPIMYQLSNMWWNYKNNQKWYYPGDGKNSFEEEFVTSIVGINYESRVIFTLFYKVVLLALGIVVWIWNPTIIYTISDFVKSLI